MSTPSRIILKVRKEDIGRKIKFDPTKLPTKLNDWVYVDEETSKVWKDEKGKEKSKGTYQSKISDHLNYRRGYLCHTLISFHAQNAG